MWFSFLSNFINIFQIFFEGLSLNMEPFCFLCPEGIKVYSIHFGNQYVYLEDNIRCRLDCVLIVWFSLSDFTFFGQSTSGICFVAMHWTNSWFVFYFSLYLFSLLIFQWSANNTRLVKVWFSAFVMWGTLVQQINVRVWQR